FLPMIIVSYGAGFVVELLFAIVRKEKIAEGFLVTGLIFPLVLPPTIPLWMLAVGVMFGVCIGKELFGGTGRNIFNPAIVGRVFLALAYPSQMSGEVWVKPGHGILGRVLDYVTIKTPTGPDEGVMATVVKFFSVNADGVRSFFTVEHIEAITSATPLGLAKKGEFIDVMRLAIGEVTGSIGETSGLMVLCGGIFLLITRVANWRTVVSILLSAFIMAFALHQSNPEKFASPTWHMFAGGLLFGAFFMATDPVSSPNTNGGKYVYGILIGAVAMLIRNFGAYTEGVMFSILLGNIFAPVIDEIFFSIRIRRLKNEE
ncbi:MAG: RnfABCDGE type electron transport complex subunit D, partial [Anaerohalosphaera sp.]|nr:RnfABCDGE type electron transport complex subunit D [Anaerohalosphaera sp.]